MNEPSIIQKPLKLALAVLLCLSGGIVGALARNNRVEHPILLGFVQVGAEGTWRMTNTKSIQESAKEAGIDLILRIGQNNRDNQIKEMKELIAQNVDVLAFSPAQNDGWDDILDEARAAKIPVIVLDRAINTKDESLYVTHIGSDMVDEGRRGARWLIRHMKGVKGTVKIVELEGTEGSTPAIHRKKGFDEVIARNPRFKIIHSKPADFTLAKGREVMLELLKMEDGDIQAVFCHNDEIGFGAIEAIESYGKKPGKDIVVVSVDAIKKAFEMMIEGKLNCTIECSPLLGPQLMKAVKDIKAGKPVPKRIITDEKDYPAGTAKDELPKRTY